MKLKLTIITALVAVFLGFAGRAFAGCHAAFSYSVSGRTVTLHSDSTNGHGTKYEWAFGDGASSHDASLSHTFAADGVYTICLSAGDSTCHNKECHTITIGHPKYCITGNLYRGGDAGYPGFVVRYKYNATDSSWHPVDTATIHYSASNGATYEFGSVEPGIYIVEAFLASTATGYKDYAPTYYKDATTWGHATKIEVKNECIHHADIHFHKVEKKSGEGKVSGHEKHGHKKTADEAVQIILFDANDSAIACTTTDADGFYSFTGLAYGTYKVYAEVIGLPTYPTMVTLSATNKEVNNADITIGTKAVFAGLQNNPGVNGQASINIYPNPVKNILNLNISSQSTANVTLTITDLSGKVLKTTRNVLVSGTNNISMDLDTLPAGIYIINLQGKSGDILTHTRFVKE